MHAADRSVHRRPLAGVAVGVMLVVTLFVACAAPATAQQDAGDLSPAEARRLARDVLDKGPPVGAPDLPELGEPPDFALPGPPGEGAPGISAVGWVILAVLGAAVIAGLGWAVVAVVRDRRRDDADDDDADPDVTSGRRGRRRVRPGTADEFARRADDAAAAGDFATALALLHRAGLARLDEDRVVRFLRGRTNGDYASIVASLDPRAGTDLTGVSVGTEAVQFGKRPADADDWHRARETWERLRAELAAHRGAATADRGRDVPDVAAATTAREAP